MTPVVVQKKRRPKYRPTTICGKCGHLTESPCKSSDAVANCHLNLLPARVKNVANSETL